MPPSDPPSDDEAQTAWLIHKARYERKSVIVPPAPPKQPQEALAGTGRRVPIDLRDPQLPIPPTEPCPKCGCRQYWRKAETFTCYDCTDQKPPHETVEEWWYIVP